MFSHRHTSWYRICISLPDENDPYLKLNGDNAHQRHHAPERICVYVASTGRELCEKGFGDVSNFLVSCSLRSRQVAWADEHVRCVFWSGHWWRAVKWTGCNLERSPPHPESQIRIPEAASHLNHCPQELWHPRALLTEYLALDLQKRKKWRVSSKEGFNMDPFALYKRIKNQGWPPAASRYAPKCTTAGTFPQRLRWSLTGRTPPICTLLLWDRSWRTHTQRRIGALSFFGSAGKGERNLRSL